MDFATSSGFRDILADEALARERISREVQDCFAARGYVPIETPTLENMAVMQAGGRLPSSSFRFFDAQGDLLTMRPDVTLQVARLCAMRLGSDPGPFRFRYRQRVFREAEGRLRADSREKTQMGIECIGDGGVAADAEVVSLFIQALEIAGVGKFSVSIATVGVLRALLTGSGAPKTWVERVLEAFHASNFVAIDALTTGADPREVAPVYAQAISSLARIRGGREAIEAVRALAAPLGCCADLDEFAAAYDLLDEAGLGSRLLVDFSVMSSFDYYTGIVFEAFAPGLGTPLGGGGRYDDMLGVYGAPRPAAGFAFFLEEAMEAASVAQSAAADSCEAAATAPDSPAVSEPFARPLRIAVPKGSLNADCVAALQAAGLDVAGLSDPGRALIVKNPGVEYVIVRPTDAPVFVEMGAADCGICGEDSLLEAAPDVVELVDLKFGGCRFVVAEPEGAAAATAEHYRRLGSIRVATKYPRITAAHYAKTGVQVEIVELHGNIELGPLTGVSERIVDITATGTTLRENNLVVVEEVLSSTARFFANVCAFRTDPRIQQLARALAAHVQTEQPSVACDGSREGE